MKRGERPLQEKMKKIIAIIILMSQISSCTYLREALGIVTRRPTVSLKSIQLDKMTFQEIKLLVSVQVENPNSFELNFQNLNYTLNSDEVLLASGYFKEAIVVPSNQTRVIPIPLLIDSKSAQQVLKNLFIKRQPISLRWHARALFKTPLGVKMEVGFYDEKKLL